MSEKNNQGQKTKVEQGKGNNAKRGNNKKRNNVKGNNSPNQNANNKGKCDLKGSRKVRPHRIDSPLKRCLVYLSLLSSSNK